MNDEVNDVETGDDVVVDAPVETPDTATNQPEEPTTPPVDVDKLTKENEGLKSGIANERKKRQVAEQEMQRIQTEQDAGEFDPLDPESVEKLVDRRAKAIIDANTAEQTEAQRAKTWQKKLADGKQKYVDVDFDAITVDPSLLISGAMAEVIERDSAGIDLLVHLHNNREESARIAALPPSSAIMELGRISTKLQSDADPQLSNAPDPITPVGSRGVTTKDPDDMTHREYEAYLREKNGGSVFPKR